MKQEEDRRRVRSLVWQSGLLALLCLPVILWQAWRLNHRVLRVPEAEGISGLVEGPRAALRLLLIGESTSAGVGVEHNRLGLAGELAAALAAQLDRSVHWRVLGLNGHTARQTRMKLCPQVAGGSADLVIIVHGFNDTVSWTSPGQWQREITGIIRQLETRLQCPRFVLTGIPPFQAFPQLPEPTRTVLSLRSSALEITSELLANDISNMRFVRLKALPGSDYYCHDGFHPSARGYTLWATELASDISTSEDQH